MSRSSTVDFTLRANITDLKSELGKIPGITDKEARKMAGAMEKGLLRAEKAAKRASQAMRGDLGKSVDQAIEKTKNLALAAGMSEESFNKLKTKATEVAGTVDGFADKAGRADSSLSAMAAVIHNVNPELAELTRQAGDALGAVEGLILAAAQSPVTFTATAAAVGALYVAFGDVNEELERSQKASEKADRALKKLNSAVALNVDVSERLRQKQAAMNGENIKIRDDFEQMERDIIAVVKQYDSLAGKGIISESLAESTRTQAQAQIELNRELFEYELQQERNIRKNKEAKLSAEVLKIATNDRLLQLRTHMEREKQAGQVIRASYSEQALAQEIQNIAVDEWLAKQKEKLAGLLEEADGNNALTEALANNPGEYKNNIDQAVQLTKSLEKLTDSKFKVIDANGYEVQSGNDWLDNYRTQWGARQITIGIIDEETGKIYEAGEAVVFEQKLRKQADKDRKESNKLRQQQSKEQQEAAIRVLDAEVAAINKRASSAVDALELEKLTTAQRIDLSESRALAELDAVRSRFAEEKALTEEHVREIEEAEKLIREQARIERENLAAEERAREIELFEKQMAARSALVLQNAKEEQRIAKEAADYQEQVQADSLAATSELFSTAADFMMDKAESRSAHNRQLAMRDFKISKAIASSEAIINAAGAITEIWDAHAENPILAGALTAISAAVTGAQIAKIAAQEPSFDVGGIIAPASGGMARTPDQVQIRALPGEAVLNRQAVDSLGAGGVDRLNSGAAAPVVVRPVSTFKHFDRFTKAEFRRSGYFRSLFDQDREFAPGQRSY